MRLAQQAKTGHELERFILLSMAKRELTRSHCNECGRPTRHHVLCAKQINDSTEAEGYGEIQWADKYELVECAGCESVSMRHTYWFEPTDDTVIKTYPPPVARRRPSWRTKLPRDIRQLLDEVYSALDANSRALATMGSRAVLDMVLVQQAGDVGSFGEKLKALEAAGVVGRKNRQVLEAALDAGSAAAHRGHHASSEDVNAVMDILENLLQAIYHLEGLAERLKERTPPRKKSR
jgi:Domain of unknown function (DUF4145)